MMKDKQLMPLIGLILIVYSSLQSVPLFLSRLSIFTMFVISIFILITWTRGIEIRLNYYVLFSCVWILYSLLSYFWIVDIFLWFRNILVLIVILATIIVFQSIITRRDYIIKLSKVWFVITIALNLLAWINILFGYYPLTFSDLVEHYKVRVWPVATFYNTNDFCTYLMISLAIAFIYIMSTTRLSIRILGGLTTISSLIVCYVATSRANLLALAFGVTIILFLIVIRLFYRKYNRKIVLTVLSLLILALFSFFLIRNDILQKVIQYDAARYGFMRDTLEYLKDSKYKGVGAGNLEHYLGSIRIHRQNYMAYAHNWWVEVLGNYGVLIFIGYILFWSKLIVNNIKSFFQGENISLYLIGVIAIFSISILSPSSIQLMKWLPIVTGYIVASTELIRSGYNEDY